MQKKLSHAKEAWLMNLVVESMNNEEAYYASGWLWVWVDECSFEDCKEYFSDEESFNELKGLYLEIFEEYYEDGFYNVDNEFFDVEDYIRQTLEELGIKGELKETDENLLTVVSADASEEGENEENEKSEKLEEDISFEDIIEKLNDSDGDFVIANDEEGNPFLIVYDWKDVQALQKVIKPDFEPKDEYDTSVFDELKNIDWGFADEWAKCDECDKLIRTSPDSYSFKPDYWFSDEHGLLCGDCVRNNHDVSLEYVRTMINNAEKANTILGENELEELGFTLIDKDFENGWYDRHDSPEEILETALEKHPEGAFLFSISGVGQFATQFELWGADLEEDKEEEIEETLKVDEKEIIKDDEESLEEEKISAGVRKIIDLINGRTAKRYGYTLTPDAIIFGEKGTKNHSTFKITKEQYRKLIELGYGELKESLDEEEIDSDSIQVYQFPNEFKIYLPEFKKLCKEHDVKYLGKGKNVIDNVKTPDYFVEGRYADLIRLADEFDYKLHQDYLCSADTFAYADILFDKNKQEESILKEDAETSKSKGFTKEEATKFAKELIQKFFDDGGYYDIWSNDKEIQAQIDWGDWKHDHLYFKSVVKKFFDELGINIEIETDVTEEDGSDTYSALHTITKV